MNLRIQAGALAVLLAFFVSLGLWGIDFGDEHWDEPTNVKQLVWALEHHRPFPRFYHYPTTMMMALGVAALPEIVTHGVDGAPAALMERPYRLRARSLFVFLTSISIVATWSLAKGLRRPAWEALFAAALVATSWELGTHARFLAPDGLLVAAATTSVALVAGSRGRAWPLWAGAFVGGVAAGAKYTAGILVLTVVVEAWGQGGSMRPRAWRSTVAAACCALGFFLSTPGAVFEPREMVAGLQFQAAVYGQGWLGYTVDGPLQMFHAIVGYCSLALLSPFKVVAFLLACLAAVGAVAHRRDDASRSIWIFPIVTLALFLTARLFMSRNLLPLLPFLAILAARGGGAVVSVARTRKLAFLPIAGLGLLVAANSVFAIWAAHTVADRYSTRAMEELAAFVAANDAEQILASPNVTAALDGLRAPHPSLRGQVTTETKRVLTFPDEILNASQWPGTDPFLVQRVFGPLEVDWTYAPTWRGTPRVLLMSIDKAREIGASLTFTPPPDTPHHFPMEIMAR